jgi:FkbH-like protein
LAATSFLPYARGLVRTIRSLYQAPRKVLCTDLDNTLWGGILGEDGPDGIVTGVTYPGSPFYEYQQWLKRLSARGVLLVAISKNNEPEVREAFAARRADLALTFDSFAATRINWNDKTRSLQELAGELGLGLESFVVIDDNPVECEEIRRSLPEVEVIEASPDEPWLVLEKLSESGLFDILAITQDDQNRGSEYKAQARRAAAHKTSGGRAEFLSSLGMVCSFQSALQAPISRAVQLLHKTNQFNLTTRRHTEQEVRKFAASGQALAVRVQDRFGDAGVVGLALARYSGITCWIDTFLLSCRVIGRGVETALLAQVGEQAKRDGMTRLVGEFVPTAKNGPCASFYPDHGFTPVALTHAALPGDPVLYELDVTALRGGPCWIAMVETAAEVSRLAEVS